MTALKSYVALFALKKAVKFFRDHPDVIPGEIDDVVVSLLAKALNV
ncbi:hypothetical protein KIV63_gp08 [Mycobacterium phage SWU2]|uniref:Uncharacterized protein n=1 Tax=Mycobacterium phage SWU2 TaxID=2077150 RepID=A0A2K9VI27_9CAUD|nr:hypothetical protein KIV63_gp08 [Mycobacterium phage SWU2]AUV61967.1 hypothetical protein JX_gp08 [Mycobacterium phage SWU2]